MTIFLKWLENQDDKTKIKTIKSFQMSSAIVMKVQMKPGDHVIRALCEQVTKIVTKGPCGPERD
jgi:hypothetical protein